MINWGFSRQFFCRWQKEFFEHGAAALERQLNSKERESQRRIEFLEAKIKRKCWARICRLTGLEGIQFRDLRHTFKTNAAMSGMDRAIRNAIVGHATKLPVEDLYIHIADAKLLSAVDHMTFDHGATATDLGNGEKGPVKIPSEPSKEEKSEAVI